MGRRARGRGVARRLRHRRSDAPHMREMMRAVEREARAAIPPGAPHLPPARPVAGAAERRG